MNVTLNSQILVNELRLLNKVVPANPAIQVLGCLLLKASEGALRMWATDLEVGITTTCPVHIDEAGRAIVPAEKLLTLVDRLPDGDVTLETDKAKLVVSCGSFTSRLTLPPPDDWPQMPEEVGESAKLDVEAFRRLISRTRYAVSAKGGKYILQGALLTIENSKWTMVATDAKRLAMAYTPADGGSARVVIPTKALDVVSSQNDAGTLEFTVGGQHLFFRVGERIIWSRVIDGEFPKYKGIIPMHNDKQITINRTEFASALRRIELTAGDSKAVYMTVTSKWLELSSSSLDVGSADESVSVTYDGPQIKVCANGGYLLDFLNAASNDFVTLALKDEKTPALLMDGNSNISVLMLMKLN